MNECDGVQIQTVCEILLRKHRSKQPSKQSSIIKADPEIASPQPVLFDEIDEPLIRSIPLRMGGAAGPSGLNAAVWKQMCTSFKPVSVDLCVTEASLARQICTSYVDTKGLSVFIACQLITLNKCPGVSKASWNWGDCMTH